MLAKLFRTINRMFAGSSSSRSGSSGRPGNSKSEMARRAGEEVLRQVQKQGPDAAQRHLENSRYANNPRARQAARTADDLARRFAGTDTTGDRPVQPDDKLAQNKWGERR